jgi:hyperosmotically inducible periplasmic protein
MPYNKKMLAVLAAAGCAMLAGCDNTAQGVKEDARENEAKVREEAAEAKADTADERAEIKEEGREAGSAIREAGRDVGDAAERAGDAVAGAAKDVGATVHAGKQTLDVKAALMADSAIDASRIDVDTDENTKTVTLKGTVPSAAQKASAERIARDKAEGYKVRNNLTVTR